MPPPPAASPPFPTRHRRPSELYRAILRAHQRYLTPLPSQSSLQSNSNAVVSLSAADHSNPHNHNHAKQKAKTSSLSVMQQLGNAYVKNEFTLHKKASPPQAAEFMRAWEQYLHHLTSQAAAAAATKALSSTQEQQHEQYQHPQSLETQEFQPQPQQFGMDLPSHVELSSEQAQQLQKLKKDIIENTTATAAAITVTHTTATATATTSTPTSKNGATKINSNSNTRHSMMTNRKQKPP